MQAVLHNAQDLSLNLEAAWQEGLMGKNGRTIAT